jgi:hypothetical protein
MWVGQGSSLAAAEKVVTTLEDEEASEEGRGGNPPERPDQATGPGDRHTPHQRQVGSPRSHNPNPDTNYMECAHDFRGAGVCGSINGGKFICHRPTGFEIRADYNMLVFIFHPALAMSSAHGETTGAHT